MPAATPNPQFIGSESALAEPHFDEEATVLSARPVVPLAEVQPSRLKASLPRPWVLGLGLVGALLVGVFATVIYYSRLTENDPPVFEGLEVTAGVEGKSTGSFSNFGGPVSEQPKVDVNKTIEAPKQVSANNRSDRPSAGSDKKPRARLVSVIRDKQDNNHIEEVVEDRRAARKQARQERRRAERERRNGRSSDELLRIRDIFEGSPRP